MSNKIDERLNGLLEALERRYTVNTVVKDLVAFVLEDLVVDGPLSLEKMLFLITRRFSEEEQRSLFVSLDYPGYDGGYQLGLVRHIQEPEEEYLARTEKIKVKIQEHEAKEYAKYLELKKKFESKK